MSYQFKVGDKGKTRGGDDYEVIAVRPELSRAVVTIRSGMICTNLLDGTYGIIDKGYEQFDLLPPKREVKFYVNIYQGSDEEDRVAYGYANASIAEKAASFGALTIAHPVTVELP